MNHDRPNERREIIRRNMDTTIDGRLAHLETSLDALDAWVRDELRNLDERLEEKLGTSELRIAEKAVDMAVHRAFSHLGVNIDNPDSLQVFRDDLRFGGVFRNAVQKGFFAFLAAICGAIGVSIWLVLKKGIGLP